MNTILKCSLVSLAILASVQACKTTSSEVDYAHWSKETLGGTPSTQLEALKDSTVKTNFSAINICVQNQVGPMSDKQLMFETKLAFAMWLHHSGEAEQSDWEYLRFKIEQYCDLKDTSHQAIVKLASFDRADTYETGELNRSFYKPGSGWTTMGFGGPGSTSYEWDWKRDLTYKNRVPAKTILNPYIEWEPLEGEIASHRRLSSSVKESILKDIRFLQASEGLFSDYVELARKFEESSALVGPVYNLSKRVAFDVLLHEVGHMFGLTHADNPGANDVTGESEYTDLRNGRHVTDESSMAYADNYLYLTKDDQAGAKAAKRASLENLDDMRYRYKEAPPKPVKPSSGVKPVEPKLGSYKFCETEQGQGFGSPFSCGEFKCAKVNDDWDNNGDEKYCCRVR